MFIGIGKPILLKLYIYRKCSQELVEQQNIPVMCACTMQYEKQTVGDALSIAVNRA